MDVDIGSFRVARLTKANLVFGDTIASTSVVVYNYVSGSPTLIGPSTTAKHLEFKVIGCVPLPCCRCSGHGNQNGSSDSA